MSLQFEWDPDKAASNLAKHGVSFDEAATVFADPTAAIFADPVHSTHEVRELLVGYSERNRLLIISFTDRPPNVRVISARQANARERKRHEEHS